MRCFAPREARDDRAWHAHANAQPRSRIPVYDGIFCSESAARASSVLSTVAKALPQFSVFDSRWANRPRMRPRVVIGVRFKRPTFPLYTVLSTLALPIAYTLTLSFNPL